MNEEPGQREQEGTRHDAKMCHDVELSFVWCKYGLGRPRRWEGGTVSCVWFWFRCRGSPSGRQGREDAFVMTID